MLHLFWFRQSCSGKHCRKRGGTSYPLWRMKVLQIERRREKNKILVSRVAGRMKKEICFRTKTNSTMHGSYSRGLHEGFARNSAISTPTVSFASSNDNMEEQPTKWCPKYIWVDVIARFTPVLSRQFGVEMSGNQPREVLSLHEIWGKWKALRLIKPQTDKKIHVIYKAAEKLSEIYGTDYHFEGQQYFKHRCDSRKREKSAVG